MPIDWQISEMSLSLKQMGQRHLLTVTMIYFEGNGIRKANEQSSLSALKHSSMRLIILAYKYVTLILEFTKCIYKNSIKIAREHDVLNYLLFISFTSKCFSCVCVSHAWFLCFHSKQPANVHEWFSNNNWSWRVSSGRLSSPVKPQHLFKHCLRFLTSDLSRSCE